MAAGDIKWISGGLLAIGNKVHNLGSDSFKLGLVTSTVTPAIADTDGRWGAGGSVNYATNEVTPGGNYSAGGIALTGVSWSNVSSVPTFRATDPTVAQHASNPTNARWGVIYNDTDASKRAVAFVDLGAVKDLTLGLFTVNFGGAGTDVLTLTQS